MTFATNTINPSLYKSLPFDFQRDIAPVSGLADLPLVLVVNKDVPAKDVNEFVAYAKANPGKIAFASFGARTISHLAIELLKTSTGIDFVHVPYPGGPQIITDMISGRIQAGMDALPNSLPHIRSGAVRALAVHVAAAQPRGPRRADHRRDHSGPRDQRRDAASARRRRRRAEIVERLNRDINAGLADAGPEVALRRRRRGADHPHAGRGPRQDRQRHREMAQGHRRAPASSRSDGAARRRPAHWPCYAEAGRLPQNSHEVETPDGCENVHESLRNDRPPPAHRALREGHRQATADFYEKAFGLERTAEVTKGKTACRIYMSDGEVNLALLQYKSEVGSGVAQGLGRHPPFRLPVRRPAQAAEEDREGRRQVLLRSRRARGRGLRAQVQGPERHRLRHQLEGLAADPRQGQERRRRPAPGQATRGGAQEGQQEDQRSRARRRPQARRNSTAQARQRSAVRGRTTMSNGYCWRWRCWRWPASPARRRRTIRRARSR